MPVLTKINTNVIADDAVTSAKLVGGAVDADIGVGSVTASHIAADAVGASELADDAVLPANISHLGDGTGNLSGTLTGEQLRFGTAFTLTDDLTVNGDVTLGKVGDDSTGQSLTQNTSANRTLTGTGTLRMGSSMSSVDGMTGALGSAVNLDNATFSAVGYAQLNLSGNVSTQGNITWATITGDTTNITKPSSNHLICLGLAGVYLITFSCSCTISNDDERYIRGRIYDGSGNLKAETFSAIHDSDDSSSAQYGGCTATWVNNFSAGDTFYTHWASGSDSNAVLADATHVTICRLYNT